MAVKQKQERLHERIEDNQLQTRAILQDAAPVTNQNIIIFYFRSFFWSRQPVKDLGAFPVILRDTFKMQFCNFCGNCKKQRAL